MKCCYICTSKGQIYLKEKNNPLILATGMGRLDMVDYLINQGADVNSQALMEASAYGHVDMEGCGCDPNLSGANHSLVLSSCGRLEVVKVLQGYGADITAQDNLPLLLAYRLANAMWLAISKKWEQVFQNE